MSRSCVIGAGAAGVSALQRLREAGYEVVFDGVLIANGHLWSPHVPAVPGDFTGTRVLVVGAGNSGCDIAMDVAQNRLDTDVLMHKGRYFQAKAYSGVPRAEVPFLTRFSPDEQDLINRMAGATEYRSAFSPLRHCRERPSPG